MFPKFYTKNYCEYERESKSITMFQNDKSLLHRSRNIFLDNLLVQKAGIYNLFVIMTSCVAFRKLT